MNYIVLDLEWNQSSTKAEEKEKEEYYDESVVHYNKW